MTNAIESWRFHFRYGWFNTLEQFGDWRAAIATYALAPFFIWLLSRVWERFNGALGNFTLGEVILYIGLTEVMFMTFIRSNSISRASGDFSIALARPRSWLTTSFSGLVGRSLGNRVLMLLILIPAFPLLGADPTREFPAIARFVLLLPWLAVLQGLVALFFAIAQVLWHQTDYFLFPVSKVFLVLGGVWGPVTDFSEPWRTWLLRLPPADLFFQPAYFCVKGQFHEMSASEWFLRTGALAVVLLIINIAFFRVAKKHHQSFGG